MKKRRRINKSLTIKAKAKANENNQNDDINHHHQNDCVESKLTFDYFDVIQSQLNTHTLMT